MQHSCKLSAYVRELAEAEWLHHAMQCRQKTVEVKAKCGTCTMYFCPRCLLNRYGEEVGKVSLSDAVLTSGKILPIMLTSLAHEP